MAFMVWINIFLQILWTKIMPIVGTLAVIGLVLVMMGHQVPVAMFRDKLGRKLIGRGSRILGRTLIAIKNEDGLWTLKPGEYDSDNNGYWVPTEDGREFYDASGVGGDPGGWYGGTALAVAYDGLGALAEAASAEVGRQARIKKRAYAEDLTTIDYAQYKAGEAGKNLLAAAGDRLELNLAGRFDSKPVTDGGKTVIGEWDTMIPTRKVIDLRDTLENAPFHVRPQQFHSVAESAKKGQQGFASLGPLGQAGLLMGAFMLGAIVAYIGFSAAGGGGGGISIPMGGSGMIVPPTVGVLP